MFKAIILLKRKDELTFDEFKNHWLKNHSALVRQLPGLRKAVFNFNHAAGEEGDFDGVSELWFDTEADFIRAYASEIGRQVAADSLSRVSKRIRVLCEEHTVFEFEQKA